MPDNPAVTNPTVDYWWSHPSFIGQDEEIAAKENLYSEGHANSINIPWLLGISVAMGNGMTEAIAKSCIAYVEPEFGLDGGGGGNESGAQAYGGAQSGGTIVSW